MHRGGVLLFAVLFCFSAPVHSAGRTGFSIAKTLMNARSLALGGANVSEQGLGRTAFLNPAIASGNDNDVSFSYAKHTLDLWSGMVYLSSKIRPNLTGGISLSTFDYGDFEVSEVGTGLTGDSFDASEYIMSGNLAGKLNESIDIGISVKYLWGNIQNETAKGLAIDAGTIWNTGWENVNLAIVIRNMKMKFNSYGSEDSELPTELLIGGSRAIDHLPLTVYSVLIASQSGEEDWTVDELLGSPGLAFAIGGEFQVATEGKSQPMFIRLGYRSRGQGLQMGHRLDSLAGFSFGAGFIIKNFNIDYTYAPMGAFGDIHRFSFATNILNRDI